MTLDPAAQRPWKPLLDGELGRHAERVLDDIAAALATPARGSPALADGAAGRALFFAYLAEARGGEALAALVDRHLDAAVDGLAQADLRDALFSGFAGVAWTAQHLQGRFDGDGDDDANAGLDALLGDLLDRSPWPGHFDLVFGLVGHGVYALERLARPTGRGCLERVVARLAELAEPRHDGLGWRSRPELLLPERRRAHPRGYFDLGAAHGAPSLATVLAGACAAGVATSTARPLLDGCVRALLHERLADGAAALPSWIADGEVTPARLAWCYGDAGAAAALLAAARAVDEQPWVDAALALGRRAATRALDGALEEAGVVDAGLCHGAAGLALLFHRLWSDTPDHRFAEAAQRLYRHTLSLQRPGLGVAGYRAWSPQPDAPDTLDWSDDDGFLTGAAGVGLALLAGSSAVEPAWDRLLAASLPPVAHGRR